MRNGYPSCSLPFIVAANKFDEEPDMKNLLSVLLGVLIAFAPWAMAAADCNKSHRERGLHVFQTMCMNCHSADKNQGHVFGPNLGGVVGRPVGKAAGFEYSDALGSSNEKWDEKTLDLFLKEPAAKFPGTTMPFSGLQSEEDRFAAICYLKKGK